MLPYCRKAQNNDTARQDDANDDEAALASALLHPLGYCAEQNLAHCIVCQHACKEMHSQIEDMDAFIKVVELNNNGKNVDFDWHRMGKDNSMLKHLRSLYSTLSGHGDELTKAIKIGTHLYHNADAVRVKWKKLRADPNAKLTYTQYEEMMKKLADKVSTMKKARELKKAALRHHHH